MDDESKGIVERLRLLAAHAREKGRRGTMLIATDAADEIERLRAEPAPLLAPPDGTSQYYGMVPAAGGQGERME